MVSPPSSSERAPPPAGRLIEGDCLRALSAEETGSVDLIYVDPPFFSGRTQTGSAQTAGSSPSFSDSWQGGLEAYLAWMEERLAAMRPLLKPSGSIYVHLDWHAVHYVKVAMDRLFGYENFLNEIVWLYGLGGSSPRYWPRKHDTVLWYAREAGAHYFEAPRVPATSQRMRGRTKKAPDWWDIPSLNNMAKERVGYPTQKPEALLERIIESSCPPGGVVADFFCGSGTTLVVAERTGRTWLGCDVSPDAIRVTRKRLAGARASKV
jgi:DNA modification methylase